MLKHITHRSGLGVDAQKGKNGELLLGNNSAVAYYNSQLAVLERRYGRKIRLLDKGNKVTMAAGAAVFSPYLAIAAFVGGGLLRWHQQKHLSSKLSAFFLDKDTRLEDLEHQNTRCPTPESIQEYYELSNSRADQGLLKKCMASSLVQLACGLSLVAGTVASASTIAFVPAIGMLCTYYLCKRQIGKLQQQGKKDGIEIRKNRLRILPTDRVPDVYRVVKKNAPRPA